MDSGPLPLKYSLQVFVPPASSLDRLIDPSIVVGSFLFFSSFILAAKGDFKNRTVNDFAWLPAVVGLLFIYQSPLSWYGAGFYAVRATIALGIGLWLSKKKLWKGADTIGFSLAFAFPSVVAPAFIAGVPLVVVFRDAVKSRALVGFNWRTQTYPLVGFMAFGLGLYILVLGVLNLFLPFIPLV